MCCFCYSCRVEDLGGSRGSREVQVRAAGTERVPMAPLAKIWLLKGWKMMPLKDMQCWANATHLQRKTSVTISTGAERGQRRAEFCASASQNKSEPWGGVATEHTLCFFRLRFLMLFTQPQTFCAGLLAFEPKRHLFHLIAIRIHRVLEMGRCTDWRSSGFRSRTQVEKLPLCCYFALPNLISHILACFSPLL